jgi:hypothetical protein
VGGGPEVGLFAVGGGEAGLAVVGGGDTGTVFLAGGGDWTLAEGGICGLPLDLGSGSLGNTGLGKDLSDIIKLNIVYSSPDYDHK